jgi:phosphatidylserine decarboxylase
VFCSVLSKIPIAREGWLFISVPLGLAAVLLAVGWQLAAAAAAGLAALVALFFRDPPRDVPRGEGLIVAPADGTVMQVVRHDGTELDVAATRISIFLSVLDVHVNRAPFQGVVEKIDYRPGTFRLAWREDASAQNEQNVIHLAAPQGRMVVKQIAGFLARRIVCRVARGQSIDAGERIGIIRFGSRVDLIVPSDVQVSVRPGERVWGGRSVLGAFQ